MCLLTHLQNQKLFNHIPVCSCCYVVCDFKPS